MGLAEKTGVEDLTSWNDQFGDMEFFPEKTSNGNFEWQFGYAYACRIRGAKVVRSKFGDLQIELSIDVQGDDGESDDVATIGTTRLWLDLPKQPSDIGKDKALVIKLTQKRYQNLLRVLSAAAPADYALYAERKGSKTNYAFYDFDGVKMDGEDFNERKQKIHAACVDFADSVRNSEGEAVDLLEDTLLYVEKVENKNNAKYPYTNYYAQKPEKVAVFKSEGSDTPF